MGAGHGRVGATEAADATVVWVEDGRERRARWRSESAGPPRRVLIADDRTRADDAYRAASEGAALLWRGDFQNARQLLKAMTRRVDAPSRRKNKAEPSGVQAFHLFRQARAQRARKLGMVLVPFETGHVIPLRRAPDVRDACTDAYGPCDEPYVVSLRELLGVIGAHEWRRKGVPVPALGGDRIHPHYGVFSPIRGEYVELVARAPIPPGVTSAFDIGTGTGVLAAVLARRGVGRVVATDADPRALACAQENVRRLGVPVEVVEADLFPDTPGVPDMDAPEVRRAGLIVCNPPWLPAKPATGLEGAVYDAGGRMLRGFLAGLGARLDSGGEGWLVLSDLAEHLGLRDRDELPAAFAAAGLRVLGRLDAAPVHPKAAAPDDPLHAARAAEVTSLWRLTHGSGGRSGGR